MRYINRSGILLRNPKSDSSVTIYALIFPKFIAFYRKFDMAFFTLATEHRQAYIFCRIGIRGKPKWS